MIIPLFSGCFLSERNGLQNSAILSELNENINRPIYKKDISQATKDKTIVEDKAGFVLTQTDYGIVRHEADPGHVPSSGLHVEKKKKSSSFYENQRRKDATGEKPGNFVFNFDDADLSQVIRTFAQILNISYVTDEALSGKVTVQTSGGLTKKDVFPVFFQLLEANDLTAVKDGKLWRITSLETAPRLPLRFHSGASMKNIPPSERMIIQIISLNHIAASEMVKILEPFISSKGTIITHEKSNTILLVDKGIIALKALSLVDLFDVNSFSKIRHKFYPLKFIDVEETLSVIKDLLGAYEKKEEKINLVSLKRLNTLIALSPDPQILDWIDTMIKRLDMPGHETESKIYIYKIKNGSSEDIAPLLQQVFSQSSSPENEKSSPNEKDKIIQEYKETKSPFLEDSKKKEDIDNKEVPASFSAVGKGSEKGSSTLKGEIGITEDKVRNALIIEALPSDYRIVKNILKELDVMPRQVLITVNIVDIKLDDKDELGVEWTYNSLGNLIGNGLLSGSVGKGGLAFTVGFSDKWKAVLTAMQSEGRLNVLSSPSVLASDNKIATIDIADDIPVVTTEYKGSTSGTADVIETNVQYRKTGILLSVTPHINDKGLVTMDISQEVSNIGDGVVAGGKEYPSFQSRKVKTTLTVNHLQTIVIGGLIKEQDSTNKSGMPFLSRLPIFGGLFGKDTKTSIKTELILFITPRVINSLEDVDGVTKEFKNKMEFLNFFKEE
jgi:general secretion pathway protein D